MPKIDEIDKLIEEGKALLKNYNETKEAMLADPNIPDIIKQSHVGLGDALAPVLEILYKERAKLIKNGNN